MNVPDWIRGKLEVRDADYSEAVIQAALDGAGGTTDASVRSTGVLETAATIISNGFRAATISGAPPFVSDALTPEWFGFVGRSLVRDGEIIFAIDTSGGELALIPAMAHTIRGRPNPRTWQYDLQLPAPDGSMDQTLPYAGVIHLKYAVNSDSPYKGVAPASSASIAAQLAARSNQALSNELKMPTGGILPMAQDPSMNTLEFEGKLAKLKGRLITARTQRAGNADPRATPGRDWMVNRVGATPPDSLVTLRNDADLAFLAALQIPPELVRGGGGGAVREAHKSVGVNVLQPMGAVIQTELRLKLDAPDLTIGWESLRSNDISARARSYKGLREAGLSVKDASLNTGIVVSGDAPVLLLDSY